MLANTLKTLGKITPIISALLITACSTVSEPTFLTTADISAGYKKVSKAQLTGAALIESSENNVTLLVQEYDEFTGETKTYAETPDKWVQNHPLVSRYQIRISERRSHKAPPKYEITAAIRLADFLFVERVIDQFQQSQFNVLLNADYLPTGEYAEIIRFDTTLWHLEMGKTQPIRYSARGRGGNITLEIDPSDVDVFLKFIARQI